METLLQNLQEQQIQLQQRHFYIDDLANMENINDGAPPLPPPRKYVSIFHINGEPILPPLMTTEKRRQMLKLKEKALKIEQRLKERKQRVYCENDLINEDIKSETSRSSLHNTGGNTSQRSQDYYESKLKEAEESMILLQNIIRRQHGGVEEKSTETVNTDCNNALHSDRDENQEKLQKLRKSEILIYDNSTNVVIQLPAEKDRQLFQDHQRQLVEMECKANLNYVPAKKPSHLLLAGVNSKGLTAIPSICLNPPTPLTVNKNICETLSAAECGVSLNRTDKQNNSFDFVEDLSSDDSMITQSDKRPVRRLSKHNAKSERNPLTPVKNVSAKIQQFEAISSDTNTPQTSPEKLFKTRKSCLGTATGSMSRSATSPSIKLPTSNRSSSSRSQSLAQDSDNSPENTLVRSSSFTLEGPSKALIDHMQQQKAISNSKTHAKSPLNTTRTVARKPISSPLRAHRDTVESKAKKVQKVELKSSKLKTQQKVSQSKLAQAAVASISPYTTTALTQYTNNLSKTKRSPYDISKTSHNSLQTLQKTSTTPMRKSNSTSSNLVQNKTSKSRVSSSTTIQTPTSTTLNAAGTPKSGKESFTQMDQTQKEKFMHLLAQQQDEHRKLQQSFEMQQKLLIEQLNREMAATQLKSPTNSYNSSTTNSTLNSKRQDHKPLTAQLQNQLNLTGFSSENSQKKPTTPSYEFKQHKSHSNQQQPSPSTISNNSSYISMTKNHSVTANSQQSLYGSHHTPTSQPIPLNNSLLSSIDHSNANTSLDISTLSTQTSPETLCATPTTQNNAGNKITTSTSRRRLFTTEITDVGGESNNLSSRSTGSSTYSSGHPLGNHRQQPQLFNQSNRSPKSVLVNNNSNKRILWRILKNQKPQQILN
ncbi:serine-rich adhesin for platelets-like isoform X2 [Calliphora vicina]|uniref:serine-rich adhesin for platelets-like isoform X2 n=1 Tax=Calliphora vicina TaxID=7373 RepID=UPI00325BF5FC